MTVSIEFAILVDLIEDVLLPLLGKQLQGHKDILGDNQLGVPVVVLISTASIPAQIMHRIVKLDCGSLNICQQVSPLIV